MRHSWFLVLCVLCTGALCAIVQVSDEKRDIIDHDVVTFRFNAGPTSCADLLTQTVTRVGGWQPGYEQDVNGNCYVQNGRIMLEVFLDAEWTSYLWIDFTDTPWAAYTPTASFDSLADGSLAVSQHREPYYTATSSGGLQWNVCTDQPKNIWWVRHSDLVAIEYQGCMDSSCSADPDALYQAYQKCALGLGQVTPRACPSDTTLDAGMSESQSGVFWIENTNGLQWTAGQSFTATCTGAFSELAVTISNVNAAGTVQVDMLTGSGWAANTDGEFSTTFYVDTPGVYTVPIDFYAEAGSEFTARLSVPTSDNTWVGFAFAGGMVGSYADGDAFRASDGRLASPAPEPDIDFQWSVRSTFGRTVSSGGQDAWAMCSNSKGDAMMVAQQQQALAIDKHGVPLGDWFTVGGGFDHWQVKCHVSEDGNTALTVFTNIAGVDTCYIRAFARDGSVAMQQQHLHTDCVGPQAVHNTFDDEIYAIYSQSTTGMTIRVMDYKDGVLTSGTERPVSPDPSARRGTIARSNAFRRTAACWIGAINDVSCKLFVDPGANGLGDILRVNNNATLNSAGIVLMDASESGLFIVGWKSGNDMYVSTFDLWGNIVYSNVLIGPIGPYFDSSGFVSIRNDGVALVGREDSPGSQYALTVLNADGTKRGADQFIYANTNQGPAVELFDDGSALVSYETWGETTWASYEIPCP